MLMGKFAEALKNKVEDAKAKIEEELGEEGQ